MVKYEFKLNETTKDKEYNRYETEKPLYLKVKVKSYGLYKFKYSICLNTMLNDNDDLEETIEDIQDEFKEYYEQAFNKSSTKIQNPIKFVELINEYNDVKNMLLPIRTYRESNTDTFKVLCSTYIKGSPSRVLLKERGIYDITIKVRGVSVGKFKDDCGAKLDLCVVKLDYIDELEKEKVDPYYL